LSNRDRAVPEDGRAVGGCARDQLLREGLAHGERRRPRRTCSGRELGCARRIAREEVGEHVAAAPATASSRPEPPRSEASNMLRLTSASARAARGGLNRFAAIASSSNLIHVSTAGA
jgi:hypothetical protein